MLNTAMELAQCEKCKAYVFRCHVGGMLTIVDPGPLDGMEDVRRRLMMGRGVFRIVPGRKLARFGPLSTKGDGYLAEHWCTPGHVRATVIPTEAVGPLQAPVTPSAGPGLPSAPVGAQTGAQGLSSATSSPPSHAMNAIRHPISEGESWDYANVHGTNRNEPNGSVLSATQTSSTVRPDPSPVASDVCGSGPTGSTGAATGSAATFGAYSNATTGYAASAANISPMGSTSTTQEPEPSITSTPSSRVAQTTTPTFRRPTVVATAPRGTVKPTRCDTCGEIIRHDTPDAYSIEYDGRLVYGQHVAC